MEAGSVVRRLFGRPLLAEDWRLIGRWSFAAAWLAEDEASARQLVQARLSGACSLATSAALAAGRGDAERFTLVTALARLAKALEGGGGPLDDAANRMVEESVAELVYEGAALRSAIARECAALAPGFDLEAFKRAMLDVGQERQLLFREALHSLEEALTATRGDCPGLSTLGLFLQATLVQDSSDSSWQAEIWLEGEGRSFRALTLWLSADLALAKGLLTSRQKAWSTLARESGNAISRALCAVNSGATVARGLVEALQNEPWALPLALATMKPSDAADLLNFGVQAQQGARRAVAREAAAWREQAEVVKGLENALGLSIVASVEAREGPREHKVDPAHDLFTAWSLATLAHDHACLLALAVERGVASEAARLRDEARRAQVVFDAVRLRYEAEAEALAARPIAPAISLEEGQRAENRAQKGCLIGLLTGASVVLTYVAGGLVVGTGHAFDRLGPFVIAMAALPVSAGILGFVAVTAHRAAHAAQWARLNARSHEELAKRKEVLRREYERRIENAEKTLFSAGAELASFERQTKSEQMAA